MSRNLRIFVLTILVVWGILLGIASLSPGNRFRLVVATPNPAKRVMARRNHRFAHWIAFGVLSFLLALLARSSPQRIAAVVGVCAVGALIELLQHLIYRSPLETWDMRDDVYGAVGGFLGASVLLLIDRRLEARAVR